MYIWIGGREEANTILQESRQSHVLIRRVVRPLRLVLLPHQRLHIHLLLRLAGLRRVHLVLQRLLHSRAAQTVVQGVGGRMHRAHVDDGARLAAFHDVALVPDRVRRCADEVCGRSGQHGDREHAPGRQHSDRVDGRRA